MKDNDPARYSIYPRLGSAYAPGRGGRRALAFGGERTTAGKDQRMPGNMPFMPRIIFCMLPPFNFFIIVRIWSY